MYYKYFVGALQIFTYLLTYLFNYGAYKSFKTKRKT